MKNAGNITMRLLIPSTALALVAVAYAASGDDKPVIKGVWQPPEEDRSAFRDIIDYNIFNADRRRIADRVDRERNPPEPRETVTTRPDPVQEAPADPDALFRLAGISHDREGPIAYIEHTSTGELSRIQGPSDFSLGKITVIGYDALVYVVDDDQRSVSIGQNLTGQSAAPGGVSASGTTDDTGEADAPKPGSREAILRAMRERRERELGKSQPAKPDSRPEPKPEPTQPAPTEQTEPSAGQATTTRTLRIPADAENK